MNDIRFDELKNFEVPESWVETALNIPSKNYKPAPPIKLYRFAAGIAACVVIAVAVMLTTLFGINQNVNLIAPDPDPSQADSISGGVFQSTTDVTGPTSEIPPVYSTEDNQTATAVTEPSEIANSKSSRQGTAAESEKAKAQTSDGTNSNSAISKQNPASSGAIPQKPTGSDKTSPTAQNVEPAAEEPSAQNPTPKPTENNTPQPETKAPSNYDYPDSFISYSFSAYVDKSLAQNSVYCRIVDENGNIMESMPMYSSGRKVTRQNAGNNKIRLTYFSYTKLNNGKEYSVIFYNAQGTVLKQGTVVIGNNAGYEI